MATLITGITGVVGMGLFPLINNSDVFYLIRNGKRRIANGSLVGFSVDRVIDSDITADGCGISDVDARFLKAQGIKKIIHLAGLVKFDQELSDEIWMTNFTGTKNILALAKELDVAEYHHVSTAYAQGEQRNPYEASKLAAEKLVVESGLNHSIYRYGIVIGDSRTGEISGYDGYYGFFAGLYSMAEKQRRKSCDGKVFLPINLCVSFESTLNLVPIDWAVDIFTLLINIEPSGIVYNITHPVPPLVHFVMKNGIDRLGIEGVNYIDYRADEPSPHADRFVQIVQKAVDKQLKRYRPYVTEEEVFSLATVKKTLGGKYFDPPMIDSQLMEKLLDYAIVRGFGKKYPENVKENVSFVGGAGFVACVA